MLPSYPTRTVVQKEKALDGHKEREALRRLEGTACIFIRVEARDEIAYSEVLRLAVTDPPIHKAMRFLTLVWCSSKNPV